MNVIQKICFKEGRLEVCLNKNTYSFFQKHSVKLFCLLCFVLVNVYLMMYLRPFNAPIIGHDSGYHYLRVEALKYNIENSNLFSGIDYIFFNGGGYASFAYPSIFLYIPALLRIFGVGIGMSMTLFIVLCNIFSYYFMFLFLKKISGSPVCGTIGAVLYVLSSYRIDNIITRFALGEIQAYVFWPLILYGLYDFIFDKFKKPYILGFGFIGMFLSHSISTVMAFGLSVLLSIIFIKRILKMPKKFITLAITAVCVIAVTAYYWIPLLELISSCEMSVKQPAFHAGNNTIKTTDVFRDLSITGLGFPIFLLCTPRLFLTRKSPIYKSYLQNENIKKRKNILIAADAFMIIGIIVSFIPTQLAPWKILSKPLDFMQFPWRLFAAASVLLITAGAIYIFYITKFTKSLKISTFSITALAILCTFVHTDGTGINHTYEHDSNYYSIETEATFNVGMSEWMPRATQGNGIDTIKELEDNVLLSNDAKIQCERKNGELKFNLEKNEGVEFAKLPYVWYKGYEATDENGSKLETSMSDNGLVQVNLQGASGEITVKHKATTIRIISYIISALSIVLLLILFLKKKQKSDIENTKDNNNIKEKNDSREEDSMIKKILSSETCAECRLCCGFDNTDLWELPVIPSETEECILNQKPETKFVPYRDEKTFDSSCLEDNELFYCPMLSENGCTMGANKPFDCKIWPFRMMKTQEGELCITVAEICNGLSNKSIEELKSFLEEGLADKIFEYAKEHPSHIKDLMPDYKIIIKQ